MNLSKSSKCRLRMFARATVLTLLACYGNAPSMGKDFALLTLKGHSGDVLCVAFSPNGKILASGGNDNTIRLWNAQAGNLKRTLEGHSGWVESIAFSPDGSTFASCSDDGTVKLWDGQTGNLLQTLKSQINEVSSVAFSPDGNTLALGGYRYIELWDARTVKLKRTLPHAIPQTARRISSMPPFPGHDGKVCFVTFGPDGRTLASIGPNKFKLWDTPSGNLRRTIDVKAFGIRCAAFSPNERTFAFGSYANSNGYDNMATLWDPQTGMLKQTLKGHTVGVEAVAFSPDGKTLASASGDNTIKLWNAQTGILKYTLTGHAQRVRTVAFSPDGTTLASGSGDRTIRFWDLRADPSQSQANSTRPRHAKTRGVERSGWDENAKDEKYKLRQN